MTAVRPVSPGRRCDEVRPEERSGREHPRPGLLHELAVLTGNRALAAVTRDRLRALERPRGQGQQDAT